MLKEVKANAFSIITIPADGEPPADFPAHLVPNQLCHLLYISAEYEIFAVLDTIAVDKEPSLESVLPDKMRELAESNNRPIIRIDYQETTDGHDWHFTLCCLPDCPITVQQAYNLIIDMLAEQMGYVEEEPELPLIDELVSDIRQAVEDAMADAGFTAIFIDSSDNEQANAAPLN